MRSCPPDMLYLILLVVYITDQSGASQLRPTIYHPSHDTGCSPATICSIPRRTLGIDWELEILSPNRIF